MKPSTKQPQTCRLRTPFPRRQGGSVMVEFAIISPLALMFVLGIVQLGLMYTAKEVVNEAAFLGARSGGIQHGQIEPIRDAVAKGLIPFYQDTSIANNYVRLSQALAASQRETDCSLFGGQCFLKLEVLNPTPEAFKDFGITSKAMGNQTYIPNDNLEFRPHSVTGGQSNMTIQDANVLKIKVTYGYDLKVPLMKTVVKAIMCGIDSGLDAFGSARNAAPVTTGTDCDDYYKKGRVPIVSYATVQMQTPAFPTQ